MLVTIKHTRNDNDKNGYKLFATIELAILLYLYTKVTQYYTDITVSYFNYVLYESRVIFNSKKPDK